jgi:hypothetical protein
MITGEIAKIAMILPMVGNQKIVMKCSELMGRIIFFEL